MGYHKAVSLSTRTSSGPRGKASHRRSGANSRQSSGGCGGSCSLSVRQPGATEVAVPADDGHSRLMKEWKCEKPALILAALTRLGEGDAASVARLLSQHPEGVRAWLKRLAAEGRVRQVRGLGHARSPAVYAVADSEVGTELLRLLADRLAACSGPQPFDSTSIKPKKPTRCLSRELDAIGRGALDSTARIALRTHCAEAATHPGEAANFSSKSPCARHRHVVELLRPSTFWMWLAATMAFVAGVWAGRGVSWATAAYGAAAAVTLVAARRSR